MSHIENITARWRNLANIAAGIVPSECKNPNPCRADAEALVSDLRTLSRHVDSLIEAYGDYAVHALGMSMSDRANDFRSVLSDAIDCAAMDIEMAASDYEDSAADRMRDLSRAIERV